MLSPRASLTIPSLKFLMFKIQKAFVFAFFWASLVACASVQRPDEFEQNYPYRDVSQVLQKVRQTFPEAPEAFVSILYQAGKVQNKRYLHVQQIRLYWPVGLSTAPLAGRLQALMLEFRHPQPECASLEKGREVSFTGIETPLIELTLDMACG